MDDTTIICNRCKAELTHICNEGLAQAIKALYKWRPECGFPFPSSDEDVKSPEVPFLSEAYLYKLLGKNDARTLLALVDSVVRAVGLDPNSIAHLADKELHEEQEEIKKELARRAAAKAKKAKK